MFNLLCRLGLVLGTCYCALVQADPGDDYLHNQCNIKRGTYTDNSLTMTFQVPLGDYYVARDAPVGSPIGAPFTYKSAPNLENYELACNRNSSNPIVPNPEFISEVVAVAPRYSGTLPNIGGRDLTDRVFLTSVPGVGVAIEMLRPYISSGGTSANFIAVPSVLVPFRAHNQPAPMVVTPELSAALLRVLLVKIGDIPNGPSTIAPTTLIKGSFMPAVPNAFTLSVFGTVRQAQCSLDTANPVSDVPVPLGTWSTDDFSGPGSTTTAVPFHINLLDCTDNASGNDQMGFATAHIRLEGALGSTVLDKDLGLFSLDSTSTAKGVGIQILQADGSTAITLSEDVAVTRIVPNGAMQMNLAARFYQLPGSPNVGGGSAKGALNFTITYR